MTSMTNEERMKSGELYIASKGDLPAKQRRARLLMEKYNRTSITDLTGRQELLQQLFGAVGEHVYIEPRLAVDYGENIRVGDRFYANYDPIMLDVAPITIGADVMFGPRVSLLTPGHPLDAEVRVAGYEYAKSITIGDRVWIGGEVTVLGGVTIGDNTVVGAGAVVTKDLPANVVAVGNPARVLRPLGPEDAATWQAQRAAYDAEFAQQ